MVSDAAMTLDANPAERRLAVLVVPGVQGPVPAAGRPKDLARRTHRVGRWVLHAVREG